MFFRLNSSACRLFSVYFVAAGIRTERACKRAMVIYAFLISRCRISWNLLLYHANLSNIERPAGRPYFIIFKVVVNNLVSDISVCSTVLKIASIIKAPAVSELASYIIVLFEERNSKRRVTRLM